ncbi:hypothetical protein C772_00062 [Bhargavaea cecembensis DSE10]|uniref:DinB family protein n=1 Tax=Bhargavaea cecembensis DSE10 TaxID=1235279 RepID=M7PB79_9BACL|nr:hypothetical protein C772_00062 [Bhargavaea cecembensis DSE10]
MRLAAVSFIILNTRFGWLIQIVTHMAHHRGQLHSMLVRMGKDPGIQLFE